MPSEKSLPRADPPSAAPPGPRLFIAVALPATIKEELEGLSRDLQAGVRFTGCHPAWVRVDSVHLTLAFLGSMDASQVEPIAGAMTAACAGCAPLRMEIKRLGVFPNWHRPRVLWAGVRDRSHQITALHQRLESRLSAFGYEPERREYHPHLTLARFKSLKGVQGVEKIVEAHQGFVFGPFEAGELTLYQSVLDPAGAIHTPMARAPLCASVPTEVAAHEQRQT